MSPISFLTSSQPGFTKSPDVREDVGLLQFYQSPETLHRSNLLVNFADDNSQAIKTGTSEKQM